MRTAGACVRLAPAAAGAARRLQRLFFLHEGHDLSHFLVRRHPPLPQHQNACCLHDRRPCTSAACVAKLRCATVSTQDCRALVQAGVRAACVQGPPSTCLTIQILGHLAPPPQPWQFYPSPAACAHGRTHASAAPAHAQVTDLGSARYPQYRVWRTRPVWRTRAALLAYEAALAHASALDAALEACRPRRTLRDLV